MASIYFNLREANELIPWLEESFRSIDPIRQQAQELRERISNAEQRVRVNGGGGVDSQMESRRRLEEIIELIRSRIAEVQSRGIIVRNLETGLVDFPTLEEGREVYLCWHRGEREVAYWHEVDTGFADRQPIDPP